MSALPMAEYAKMIADGIRSSATCTVLVREDSTPQDTFAAVRGLVPCVGIASRTGRTLLLGILTEDVRHIGHNDRINLRTHLAHVVKVLSTEPERVLR